MCTIKRAKLVDPVCLVHLVHLVNFVQPNKQNKLNKQEKPAGFRTTRTTFHAQVLTCS
jgi:hypothetical protein